MKIDVKVRRAKVGDYGFLPIHVYCNGVELERVVAFDSDEGWAECLVWPLALDLDGESAQTYKVTGQITGFITAEEDLLEAYGII